MLARRWSARVADAERARYGAGLLGVLLILLAEGRVSEPTRQAGRRLVRWTHRAFAAAVIAVAALAVVAIAAGVELVAAVFG